MIRLDSYKVPPWSRMWRCHTGKARAAAGGKTGGGGLTKYKGLNQWPGGPRALGDFCSPSDPPGKQSEPSKASLQASPICVKLLRFTMCSPCCKGCRWGHSHYPVCGVRPSYQPVEVSQSVAVAFSHKARLSPQGTFFSLRTHRSHPIQFHIIAPNSSHILPIFLRLHTSILHNLSAYSSSQHCMVILFPSLPLRSKADCSLQMTR